MLGTNVEMITDEKKGVKKVTEDTHCYFSIISIEYSRTLSTQVFMCVEFFISSRTKAELRW